jgi:hypothetical protein
MMRFKGLVQVQTTSSQSVTVGDVTVTPQSQALIVRLPFGVFVWNRPTAILVEQNGVTKRLPIVNVTRILQLSLLSFILAISIASLVKYPRQKEVTS